MSLSVAPPQSLWRRFTAAYAQLLTATLAMSVAILVIPVTLQVISRYTDLIPAYIWTEEMARFLFIWMIMIGAMIGVRESAHFEVDVWPTLPRRGEAAVRILARLGILSRASNPLETFALGPNPFREGSYAGRVRHVALLRQGETMNVFFSGIGDAPEHIMMSTIDLRGDWSTWKASAPIDVLTPETSYECPDLPNLPSEAGEIEGRAKQMRDPAIFEDSGRKIVFYTICGEQGIAAAEIEIKN